MEGIQGSLFGKTSQERSAAMGVMIFGLYSQNSARPKFQCLILDDGQTPEWCEGEELMLRGDASMRNIGVSPNEERESSLWQILEDTVPEKYFLSEKACLGILRRAEKRGKVLPEVLRIALIRQSGACKETE